MSTLDSDLPCLRRAVLRAGVGALGLAGCSSNFLPSNGPGMAGIMKPATQSVGDPGTASDPALKYVLVTLDPAVVAAVQEDTRGSRFSAAAIARSPAEVRLGVGDIITITIFETQGGGLFFPMEPSARAANYVTLPNQQIGRDGLIVVPFAGQIKAAGLSTFDLQAAVAARLRQRALEPQVIVSLVERRSSTVSVIGDTDQSLRFSLDPAGERILDAIARAGGTRYAPHETLITLQRNGAAESVMLSDITADPSLNLQLQAGDTILVARQQRYFLALGAVGQSASLTQINRRFVIEDRNISLGDAIARAGGVQDDRANPSAVFLFRFERRRVLQRAGVQMASLVGDELPTVYNVDLLNPSMLFLMQRFPMRHNDLIFVSNSPSTDLLKLFQLLLPIAQTGSNVSAMFK